MHGIAIRSSALIVTALMVTTGCVSAEPQIWDFRGKIASCDQSVAAPLFHAVEARELPYFRDWTQMDFEGAATWIDRCTLRKPLAWIDHGSQAGLQAALVDIREKLADQEREKTARIAQQILCRQSALYEGYAAQRRLRELVIARNNAHGLLDRERRIGEVSGVVDMKAQHIAGAMIVMYDEQIASAFSDYKAAAGTAASPDAVLSYPPLENPCS